MSSPPTTLGQYQIIREIARSNDIVYEAYDPQMDRRVALKELSLPSGITEPQKLDRVQRFDREAKAAGRLAHPNIMRVFQVASDGERHYMAMEFLDGHTLRNEIDTKGFLPVDQAIEIAIAVLKGLSHAHANGVVHRDIKPDNIQLLSSGEIKITDFGIARLTFQPNLTMDGQVFGTPSYMSPEQVVGKEIDARSDLFSVGVLLYEMVSGTKPFAGDSVVAITYAIMNKEPDSLSQVNHSMWQVINRALDKSPALRFASAQEMIDAIEQASRQSVVLDPPIVAPGQTIYGAGGAYPSAPPVLNPYGQGYPSSGQGAIPPPVVYPYNPYQQSIGGGAAPHTPTYQQPGFTQGPIYYPAPPRQPLLKPETKHFIGRLGLFLLVMGTLAAVVIWAIILIGQAWNQRKLDEMDAATVAQMNQIIGASEGAQQKAGELEVLLPKLRGEANILDEKKKLAVIYEQIGQQQMAAKSNAAAEESFLRANDLDTENPKLMSDLAALYEADANGESIPDARIEGYKKSIEAWHNAMRAAVNTPEDMAKYQQAAASVAYEEANELYRKGDLQGADSVIHDGLDDAPQGSTIQRQLNDLDREVQSSAIH